MYLGRHVEKVQADTAPSVNIGVVHRSLEADVRRLEGVAAGNLDCKSKDSSLIDCAFGTLQAAIHEIWLELSTLHLFNSIWDTVGLIRAAERSSGSCCSLMAKQLLQEEEPQSTS